jgi:hypothetical protein
VRLLRIGTTASGRSLPIVLDGTGLKPARQLKYSGRSFKLGTNLPGGPDSPRRGVLRLQSHGRCDACALPREYDSISVVVEGTFPTGHFEALMQGVRDKLSALDGGEWEMLSL